MSPVIANRRRARKQVMGVSVDDNMRHAICGVAVTINRWRPTVCRRGMYGDDDVTMLTAYNDSLLQRTDNNVSLVTHIS